MRIAVAEKSAYELCLSRNIKHAKLMLTKGIDASYNALRERPARSAVRACGRAC